MDIYAQFLIALDCDNCPGLRQIGPTCADCAKRLILLSAGHVEKKKVNSGLVIPKNDDLITNYVKIF